MHSAVQYAQPAERWRMAELCLSIFGKLVEDFSPEDAEEFSPDCELSRARSVV